MDRLRKKEIVGRKVGRLRSGGDGGIGRRGKRCAEVADNKTHAFSKMSIEQLV